jgi:hypothetical protein
MLMQRHLLLDMLTQCIFKGLQLDFLIGKAYHEGRRWSVFHASRRDQFPKANDDVV